MRRILACFFVLLAYASASAQTPTFNSVTLSGPGNVQASGLISGGQLNISGAASLGGGGLLSGSFAGPTVLQNFQGNLTPTATLPGSPTAGKFTYSTTCANGNQGVAPGTNPTGCPAFADNNGVWRTMPSPPSTPISIGGQTVYLGGATNNQGTGSVILTCSGTFTNGNAIVTNAQGTCVDAGVPPAGGTGGGGTVGNCPVPGSVAYYAGSGSAITCLTQTNSSVVSRNSSGNLAEVTTLPSGLTIPSAILSNPNVTGTATVAAATFTGKLTTAASAVGGANLSCPQGTAPSVPSNGDKWCTTAGEFGQFNSATIGPYIGRAQLSATSPVSYNSGTGAFSCPTCLTASGGALVATAPLSLSGNTVSLGEIAATPMALLWNATTTVTNDSYVIYWKGTGHIQQVKAYTAGTSSPGFTIQVQVNGVNVTGCSAIAITASNTQGSPSVTNCTSTAITDGQTLSVTTSSVAGAPSSALVEILGTRSV